MCKKKKEWREKGTWNEKAKKWKISDTLSLVKSNVLSSTDFFSSTYFVAMKSLDFLFYSISNTLLSFPDAVSAEKNWSELLASITSCLVRLFFSLSFLHIIALVSLFSFSLSLSLSRVIFLLKNSRETHEYFTIGIRC